MDQIYKGTGGDKKPENPKKQAVVHSVHTTNVVQRKDDPGKSILGGLSNEIPADAKVQAMIVSIKPEFIKKYGKNPSMFHVLSYATQVVNGQNYFVKVWLGGDQYTHLKIYECSSELSLKAYKLVKSKNDPITIFE